MIKLTVSALLILLLSCVDNNVQYDKLELKNRDYDAGIWVCWSPETKQHGKLCTPECLQSGNAYRFCWLLHAIDCTDAGLEWQEDNCHLLE